MMSQRTGLEGPSPTGLRRLADGAYLKGTSANPSGRSDSSTAVMPVWECSST